MRRPKAAAAVEQRLCDGDLMHLKKDTLKVKTLYAPSLPRLAFLCFFFFYNSIPLCVCVCICAYLMHALQQADNNE